MNVDRPDFLEAYNAVEVPAPIVSTESPDEEADEAVDTFFRSVQSALGLGDLTYSELFERVTRPISNASEIQQRHEVQSDSLEVFRRRGGQVIASVLRISEAPESQTIRFAKYEPTKETQQMIRDLQYLIDINHGLE